MTDEESIVREKILKEYFSFLNEGFVPKAKDVQERARYRLEVEGMDIAFGTTFINSLTESVVHDILTIFKHVHYYEGKRYFECQNQLFSEWFTYQKILLLTQNS